MSLLSFWCLCWGCIWYILTYCSKIYSLSRFL